MKIVSVFKLDDITISGIFHAVSILYEKLHFSFIEDVELEKINDF